jgi:hypothetical protein
MLNALISPPQADHSSSTDENNAGMIWKSSAKRRTFITSGQYVRPWQGQGFGE